MADRYNTTPLMDRPDQESGPKTTQAHQAAQLEQTTPPIQPPMTRRVTRSWQPSPGVVFTIFALILVGMLGIGIGATVAATPTTSAPASSVSSTSNTSASSSNSSSNTTGGMEGMGGVIATSTPTNVPNATQNYGNQLATYTIDPDGAKHFTLTAEQVMWQPVKGQRILAWTLNGTVPGPTIRVTDGDHVRITVINHLPESTALHWHGLEVPSDQDGVPGIEPPINPGQSHTYDFTVNTIDVGTHWYHSHFDDNTQVTGGMYGMFIVDPRPGSALAQQYSHAEYAGLQAVGYPGAETPNFHPDLTYTEMISETSSGYFLMDGKSYPDTQPITLSHGQTVLIHLVGAGDMIHPMHLHGHVFSIIAEDGHLLPQPIQADTVDVSPGKTYDIVFYGWAAPGSVYPFHCHILTHLHNPGQPASEMGGLVTLVEYNK
jgi:FtsP/CotA-like multicopper oxidase with cupredoxin domain